MCDLIDRQAAMDALNGIINRFEQILRDIRESKVDDSVCGMCEYDGAFVGQSGDWCNECPGFEKDNCFKLSDKCRKRWLESVELPSATEESFEWCKECKEYDTEQHCCHRWTKVIRNTVEELTEQKIGKWIFCENETGEGSNTYKCSACGEIQMIISGTPKENGWAYCPHCGAKME